MCDGILDNLYWGFTFGSIGYLIANVLTEPGEILSKWPSVVKWVTRSDDSPRDWEWWQWYDNKVTWMCGKCIAGHTALWVFICRWLWGYTASVEVIVFSILTAYVLEKKI